MYLAWGNSIYPSSNVAAILPSSGNPIWLWEGDPLYPIHYLYATDVVIVLHNDHEGDFKVNNSKE